VIFLIFRRGSFMVLVVYSMESSHSKKPKL